MSDARHAAVLMLLAHASDLAPLHDWPPAGGLVDEVLEVARGTGGSLSVWQLRRLRTWARRYASLHPAVRTWYGRHAGDPAVGAALWCVLDLRAPPQGARYGRLSALWEQDHGAKPGFDLLPQLP